MRQVTLLPGLLLILLVTLQLQSVSADHHSKSTCTTLSCRTVAAQMSMMMNLSADPCQDFHEYACGNFKNIHAFDPKLSHFVANKTSSDKAILVHDVFLSVRRQISNRLFELLALDADESVKNADANQRRLFEMAHQMQQTCQSWILKDQDPNQESSEKLKSIADLVMPLFRRLRSELDSLTVEKLLAEIVSSGGGALISVKYSKGYAQHVLLQKTDDNDKSIVGRAELLTPTFFGKSIDFYPYVREISKHDLKLLSPKSDSYDMMHTLDNLQNEMNNLSDSSCFENYEIGNSSILSIDDLDSISSCVQSNRSFSWKVFMEDVLNSTVTGDFLIQVNDLRSLVLIGNYFKRKEVFAESNSDDPRLSVDMSFLIYDWIVSFSNLMPSNLRNKWKVEAYRSSQSQQLNLKKIPDTFDSCVQLTSESMMPIVIKMFQMKYHPEMFKNLENLVTLVVQATNYSIEKSTWLSPMTKQVLKQKLMNLVKVIGFQDLSTSHLMQIYGDSLREFDEASSTGQGVSFGDMLAIGLRAAARRDRMIISGKTELSLFSDSYPLDLEANYHFSANTLIISMALLDPQIYDADYPAYVNLGSIGYIVGYILSEEFNPHKIIEMNQNESLSSADYQMLQHYSNKSECVRTQMEQEENNPGHANKTLKADMADIFGVTTAYATWKIYSRRRSALPTLPGVVGQLRPGQILFLRAAQMWCAKGDPNLLFDYFAKSPTSENDFSVHHLRTKNIMRNTIYFAKEFSCKPGTPMNPIDHCMA